LIGDAGGFKLHALGADGGCGKARRHSISRVLKKVAELARR
jgi:hypothetical protein